MTKSPQNKYGRMESSNYSFLGLHKSGQKHPKLEWSDFEMVGTVGLAEARPFEN